MIYFSKKKLGNYNLDNFCRGRIKNLQHSLKDKRVKIYGNGGDITQLDILENAMEKVDGVFHLPHSGCYIVGIIQNRLLM